MSWILTVDQRLALYLNNLTGQVGWLDSILKFMAIWFVYAIPIILVIFWLLYGQKEKLVAFRVTLFGLFGWLAANNLIGFFWFRKRPFIRLMDTKELIFHQPDKSFPSDHATLGFAIAIGFILAGYKKIGWFLFIWTTVFSIARVMVGVHYPLDIMAGLIVGASVALFGQISKELFNRHIGQRFIRLAKMIRLD